MYIHMFFIPKNGVNGCVLIQSGFHSLRISLGADGHADHSLLFELCLSSSTYWKDFLFGEMRFS